MSKRLQLLIEQTQFLLSRQEEAKEVCSKAFTGLLSQIDKKVKTCRQDELKRLQNVQELIAGQAEQLIQDSQGDIDFLKDQLKALNDINKVQDLNKKKELLETLIDPSEEVMSTAEFKQSIIEELAGSQDAFNAVIEDISAALQEDNIKNVEVMLEQMAAASAEEDDDDDFDDQEEEDEEEDGCCGSSCSTGGCGSCKTGCSTPTEGTDIFGSFSAYDRELAKDKKESKKSPEQH